MIMIMLPARARVGSCSCAGWRALQPSSLADVDASRPLEMLIMINMREMNLRRINKNGE